MLLLECPNCGSRPVAEFRYGDVLNPRPRSSERGAPRDWARYLYVRPNVMGVQTEWWNHRFGCGLWFLADRHTGTNQVLGTRCWSPVQRSLLVGDGRPNSTTDG
jgi:sarcosine oxidase, subunit delta